MLHVVLLAHIEIYALDNFDYLISSDSQNSVKEHFQNVPEHAKNAIAIFSKMTTDQSLLILVADLPSLTFALRLTIHPSEQTSLTNLIYRCSPLHTPWPGQLTVQTCVHEKNSEQVNIANHSIVISSKMTTDQSLLILNADLPSLTFALWFTIHPSDQLHQSVLSTLHLFSRHLTVRICIVIFLVYSKQ